MIIKLKILNNIKMKKFFIIFFIIAAVLFAVFCLIKLKTVRNQPAVIINNQKFSVEIADTSEKRSRGLGGREGICENCGMLFIFDGPGKYSFWMKDMQFSLDILWIRGEEVVYIARNISPDFRGTIRPVKDADQVLEINGGLCDKLGIKEGSRVFFSGL